MRWASLVPRFSPVLFRFVVEALCFCGSSSLSELSVVLVVFCVDVCLFVVALCVLFSSSSLSGA